MRSRTSSARQPVFRTWWNTSIFHRQVTYYPQSKKFGSPRTDQVRRLKDFEVENQRLRKAVADLMLDKLALQEATQRKF